MHASVFHESSSYLEEDHMEAVKVFERKGVPLDWDYDDDADTLYLSFGKPKAAVGLDIGQGVVVRYDEQAKEVVGLTIVGVGRRLEEYVKSKP